MRESAQTASRLNNNPIKREMDIDIIEDKANGIRINKVYEGLLAANGIHSARDLWDTGSEPVKNAVADRSTSRAFLVSDRGSRRVEVFIKRYLKLTRRERLKRVVSFKPVFLYPALHEWDALCAFNKAGLKTLTPIAAGCLGDKTCNMTLGLKEYVRASELFAGELRSDARRRRRMIVRIAEYAGRMHAAGMAHQDFYLVHFFVKPGEDDEIYLIDLQRVLIRKKLNKRWIIKDLAQMNFSMSPFVSDDETSVFREAYSHINRVPRDIWDAVTAKSERIRRHTQKRNL